MAKTGYGPRIRKMPRTEDLNMAASWTLSLLFNFPSGQIKHLPIYPSMCSAVSHGMWKGARHSDVVAAVGLGEGGERADVCGTERASGGICWLGPERAERRTDRRTDGWPEVPDGYGQVGQTWCQWVPGLILSIEYSQTTQTLPSAHTHTDTHYRYTKCSTQRILGTPCERGSK